VTEKQRFHVGDVDDFPEGRMEVRDVGGRSLGIVNSAGQIYAIQNLCPHQLAEICRGTLGGTFLPSEQGEWIYGMDGLVVRCPRHAWEFDIRTGETVCGIDKRRLATYPVSVEDGRVYVTMRPRKAAVAPVEAGA
jgi:nitrite reductase/ring-hydroxylating ferredoxin subunit